MKKIFRGKIKVQLQYLAWRFLNPSKPYYEYYRQAVNKKIKRNNSHSTLSVNPADRDVYERKTKLQMEFLQEAGLAPEHLVIDYGCGALRLGGPLIEFLNPKRYIGLDVVPDYFSAGEKSLDGGLKKSKKPILDIINGQNIKKYQKFCPDFLLSFAVLYHIPPQEIDAFFDNIFALADRKTIIIIDYTDKGALRKIGSMTWSYPSDYILAKIKDRRKKYKIVDLRDVPGGDVYPRRSKFLIIANENNK